MFDQAADSSTVQAETNDADLFREITGRNPRAPRRFFNADASKLHHAQRKAFDDMASLTDTCDRLVATIEAEKRRDDAIALRDLQVDAVGALTSTRGNIIPGASSIGMLEHSWAQLVARAPRSIPARLRSNVNSWIRHSNGTAIARTMEVEGGRDVFAIVSPSYQPHDADQVAREVARAMPAECRGNVTYHSDGGRFSIDAILARPIDIDGDLHRVIVNVRSADNGLMSQQISFRAWRLRCLNGLAIMDSSVLKRVWHKGDPNRLRDQFADGLAMATVAMKSFADHWTRARRERFVDAQTGVGLTGPEALRRLVGHGDVVVPGLRPSDLIERLDTAWQAEPGHAIADTLNAITRAAHTTAWPFAWTTETLEQVAGEILYGRSLALPALSPKQVEALAA